MGLALPPRGFVHLAVFEPEAPGLFQTAMTFLRLGPTSEFRLGSVALEHRQRLYSPEVLHPHSATHPSRFTPPGLCLPGSRCALALTMCLDALLPRRTPWCPFNQARSRGVPSELYLTEIATPLGGTSPLAIGFPTAVADSRPAYQHLLHAPSTRLAVIRPALRTNQRVTCPSRAYGACALSAHRHRCRSGLASGV
jgi:hypothetical protein